MESNKLTRLLVGSLLLSFGVSAHAVEVSGSGTLATDYTFRGVSQTSEKGAVQAGIDVAWDSGFYIGAWGSNVDFGDEVTSELDLFLGYGFEVSEGVELDFSYIYYNYAGQESDLNYSEFVSSVSFSDLTLGLVFSPDYFGSDEDALIYNIDYAIGLNENWSIDLHLGYTDTDSDALGTDEDSYIDYLAGLNYEVNGTTFTLAVAGTDADEDENFGDLGEARAVFSVSRAL